MHEAQSTCGHMYSHIWHATSLMCGPCMPFSHITSTRISLVLAAGGSQTAQPSKEDTASRQLAAAWCPAVRQSPRGLVNTEQRVDVRHSACTSSTAIVANARPARADSRPRPRAAGAGPFASCRGVVSITRIRAESAHRRERASALWRADAGACRSGVPG